MDIRTPGLITSLPIRCSGVPQHDPEAPRDPRDPIVVTREDPIPPAHLFLRPQGGIRG